MFEEMIAELTEKKRGGADFQQKFEAAHAERAALSCEVIDTDGRSSRPLYFTSAEAFQKFKESLPEMIASGCVVIRDAQSKHSIVHEGPSSDFYFVASQIQGIEIPASLK